MNSMKWLLDYAYECREIVRSCNFFKVLESTSDPMDVKEWVHQLYYQSRDFTSALSLRHAMCQEPAFQRIFARHALEEVDHCEQLLNWMRKRNFLEANAEPTYVPPTLETQLASAYCFRSILRESYVHQVIAINLISEGVSYDFFTTVAPKLESLGLQPGRYWHAHEEIDQEHLAMGFNLIPVCEPKSSEGQAYAHIVWEMAFLYKHMFDSWTRVSSDRLIPDAPPINYSPELVAT
ncbi:iron-containing redox enzyme family protein [Nostoc sp. CHAB 5784]|uniref:iron-containing redox enzyme family protein n=1 Tax=Nostoc mirabile TaxID=2907820 RepID=UPI001E576C9E|nr:iron-containing redox enzyme family protein [Nostoc mirabile]MCC5670413.1 iron-containing redox enzyme family protein [Nostoc mirabile CHAB5784]